ncbi:MAG: hypothetical protein RIS88_676 [Pseudomonadota bacterium]|jgi:hypothetical protein
MAPVRASTPAERLPAAVSAQAGAELVPAGRGRLTWWGFEVYDATLWTARGFRVEQYASHPFVLELAYQRNFSAAEISRTSLKEMRRHGPIDPAQAERWQAQLAASLPDVKRGDRLAGVYRPGQGVAFFHNGRLAGEVADAQFARLFFAIWLGEATSAPDLRQALTAGGTKP